MFFELVSILFAIVPDYVNDYMTKENKNWTSSKNFAPKWNLNHSMDILSIFLASFHFSQFIDCLICFQKLENTHVQYKNKLIHSLARMELGCKASLVSHKNV